MKNRIKAGLIFFVISLIAINLSADRIIKTNGEEIKGKIVHQWEDTIVIELENGKILTIKKDELKEVQKSGEQKDSENRDYILKVERLQAEGKHWEVISWVNQSVQENPDLKKTLSHYFEKSLNVLISNSDSLLNQNDFQKAHEQYSELYLIVTDQVTAKLFVTPESWLNFKRNIVNKYVISSIKLATSIYKTDLAEAKNLINLVATPKGNNPSLIQSVDIDLKLQTILLVGSIYEWEGKAKKALDEYEKFFEQNKENPELFQLSHYLELDKRITELVKRFPSKNNNEQQNKNGSGEGKPKTILESIDEQAKQHQKNLAEAHQKKLQQLKVQEEQQQASLRDKIKNFFSNMASSDFWQKLIQEIMAGTYTVHILVFLGVVLIFWWLPRNITMMMLRQGVEEAGHWYPSIKTYGIFPFIGMISIVSYRNFNDFVARVRGIKTTRKQKPRCPKCRKRLDDIQAYGELNFLICPHCQENITPVFEIRDYLVHLIEQVELTMLNRRSGSSTKVERDAMHKLVNVLLTVAVRERATDLHISPEEDGMEIKERIDGSLRNLAIIPRSIGPALSSALMVIADLDITERQIPQDGRFSINIDDNPIDIRINTSPSSQGDNVSMRILDKRRIQLGPKELGLEGQNKVKFERAIQLPHGLILVTGPTGSGKSTTLYVALNMLNDGKKNIITIEDPIEYNLKGLNQQQVNNARNFTFATGLRSILRQDPDIIMVGEIRDKETAEISVEASLTGHLVFTTLHTIDAPSALTRMRDIGIEARRYSPALSMVMAQRLIRLTCKNCREKYQPSQSDFQLLDFDPPEGTVFYRGAGCNVCGDTGFFGRSGIYEIMEPKQELRDILETDFTSAKIRDWASKNGMRTLREVGKDKIIRRLTTIDEIVRVTS